MKYTFSYIYFHLLKNVKGSSPIIRKNGNIFFIAYDDLSDLEGGFFVEVLSPIESRSTFSDRLKDDEIFKNAK